MLKGQPFLYTLLLNLIFGTLWHYLIFLLCVFLHPRVFSPQKRCYQPHRWEHGGKFYCRFLKIKRWKDRLPQHIGKNGFSKDHLDNLSLDYIDRFIVETCRGEWNHSMNCLYTVILLFLNDFPIALIGIFFLLLGNLPFVCIQRYNRFRLLRLRQSLLHRAQRRSLRHPSHQVRDSFSEQTSNTETANNW